VTPATPPTPPTNGVRLTTSDLVAGEGLFACSLHATSPSVERVFEGLAPLSHATPNTIAFLANEKYLDEAYVTRAGAILCSPEHGALLAARFEMESATLSSEVVVPQLLLTKEPYVAFARVAQVFFKPAHPFEGRSAQAYVDASAQVASSATLFPFCFVGPGARIGARTVVYSGVFIGAGSVVGDDCILYPNAVVREGCRLGDRCLLNPGAVLGGDGFGFAPSGLENVKIPQVGGVRLADDVEVGANSAIDRGALLDTTVGPQTKIDSLVMVAHNVQIGRACFIAGQAGIAGSSKLGDKVTLAGQVGVSGHVTIADNVVVLAKAGVSKGLSQPGLYNGIPARPNREYLLGLAALMRLSGRKKSETKRDEK
jgi:UDP-3-O-[3-hydroxymyristoyl] glucosamine N-acyltransferase